ncbi:MAG: translation initiation factor IF-2 N-terminal domain-containing protein, partial [Sedimentisphaerales bacterium]|nr:translation initiation factor IF-2 N-terminal domain-containing protein [Sedimentisphaerales bacterium]
MAKTTRVHLLAKELGVNSKAIIDKCQAENLDIKNHMSTISAGLAATIREWFSEGEHSTTVEEADRVDLTKVRVRKKKKKPVQETEPAAGEQTIPVEEAEAVVSEVAIPSQIEEPVAPTVSAETAGPEIGAVAVAESQEGPVAEAPLAEPESRPTETPKIEEKQIEPIRPKPVIHRPEKPKNIKPAGPMLEKPKPAQVSGPRIVRVESVEPDALEPRRPRSGPGRRPRYEQPISEPLMPVKEAASETGKKHRDKTHGRRKETPDETVSERKRSAQRRMMRERDLEDRRARLAAAGGTTLRGRPSRRIEAKKGIEAALHRPEKAVISEPITVKDLSAALAAKTAEIIAKLLEQGVMATANQVIATEVAEMIALEMGTELIVERKQLLWERIDQEFRERPRKQLIRRSPVVAMLGHVDHGKTSLLDKIRRTSVAAGEAGGITQHIGAYQVELHGKKVTFLDTPGHEAFTAMRARGANMTDVVVLVVAADDGLMPQTIEAIHHAKAAGVNLIVALNKIDLPGVDINRIYGQLSEHELTPTEWGGQTEVVKTSAVTGAGIEDLIDHIDYIAELKNFQADPSLPATGWVVEAKRTSAFGAVATLLLKEGKLEKG